MLRIDELDENRSKTAIPLQATRRTPEGSTAAPHNHPTRGVRGPGPIENNKNPETAIPGFSVTLF